MPKLKTNRAAAKRFKLTGSGKFRHRQSHHSHLLTKKSSKRKRHLRPHITIDDTDIRNLHRLLPYTR